MIVNLKTGHSDYFERTDTFIRYQEEIRRYRLLSDSDTMECFQKIRHGTKEEKESAKRKLVNANQRFILAMAKKYGTNENYLDLVEEGNIGLLEAIEKYDTEDGSKFLSFAVWYVRRAMNHFSSRYGSVVRKTNISKTWHYISRATNKFLQKEQRQPTLDELIEVLNNDYNVDIKDANDVIETKMISIDQTIDGFEEGARETSDDYALLSEASSFDNLYNEEIEREFQGMLVGKVLETLSKREREIITLYFGIGYDRAYELGEISEKLGLTKERVRQIRNTVVSKLKEECVEALKET